MIWGYHHFWKHPLGKVCVHHCSDCSTLFRKTWIEKICICLWQAELAPNFGCVTCVLRDRRFPSNLLTIQQVCPKILASTTTMPYGALKNGSQYWWWFRNPANSLVEIGSWNPIIYRGFSIIPGAWEWDFWSINRTTQPTRADPKKTPSCFVSCRSATCATFNRSAFETSKTGGWNHRKRNPGSRGFCRSAVKFGMTNWNPAPLETKMWKLLLINVFFFQAPLVIYTFWAVEAFLWAFV